MPTSFIMIEKQENDDIFYKISYHYRLSLKISKPLKALKAQQIKQSKPD